jgi:hypothetical protein
MATLAVQATSRRSGLFCALLVVLAAGVVLQADHQPQAQAQRQVGSSAGPVELAVWALSETQAQVCCSVLAAAAAGPVVGLAAPTPLTEALAHKALMPQITAVEQRVRNQQAVVLSLEARAAVLNTIPQAVAVAVAVAAHKPQAPTAAQAAWVASMEAVAVAVGRVQRVLEPVVTAVLASSSS